MKTITHQQNGTTLVELLVGLSIGLLVIGVATGALLASRGISGTVSDATSIQQQAAYAMRVIGMQVRQSGSLYLDITNTPEPDTEVFLVKRKEKLVEFDESGTTFRFSADEMDRSRDCLGGPAGAAANTSISSKFFLENNELKCIGTGGAGKQPIANNVADFKIRYLIQKNNTSGNTSIEYKDSPENNDKIQAVEICMVLYGSEVINMPENSNYSGCDLDANGNPAKISIPTLTGDRANRLHLVFRNVFQLRSQGDLL